MDVHSKIAEALRAIAEALETLPTPAREIRLDDDNGVGRLLKLSEVSQRTCIPKWRVYEMIQRGVGPATVRIGRVLYITERALAAWIESGGEQRDVEVPVVDEVPRRKRRSR